MYLEKLIASARGSHENIDLSGLALADNTGVNTRNRTPAASPDFIKEGVIDFDTHERPE